jgi:hypothetical protein
MDKSVVSIPRRDAIIVTAAAALAATIPATASAQTEDPELLRLGAELDRPRPQNFRAIARRQTGQFISRTERRVSQPHGFAQALDEFRQVAEFADDGPIAPIRTGKPAILDICWT